MNNYLNFTYSGYKTLLHLLTEHYCFKTLGELPGIMNSLSTSNILILRHDVDFSLNAALKMAELENQMSVVATYYLLPDTKFYNLLDPEIFEAVKKIIGLNHKIGLHFDLAAYPANLHELKITQYRTYIESIFSIELDSISFHTPSLSGLGNFDKTLYVQELVNSYAEEISQKFIYRSDSMARWRDHDLVSNIKSGAYSHLHLLIHPEWWTEHEMNRDDKFMNIIESYKQKLALYFNDVKNQYFLKETM